MITLVAHCDDHVYVIQSAPENFLGYTVNPERVLELALTMARLDFAYQNLDLVHGINIMIALRREQLLNNPS